MYIHILEAQKSQRERQISGLALLLLLSMGTTTSFSGLLCFIRTASCFIAHSRVNSLITRKSCRSCTSSCPVKLKNAPNGWDDRAQTNQRRNPMESWADLGFHWMCVHLPAGCNMPQSNHFTSTMVFLWLLKANNRNWNYNPINCPPLQSTCLFDGKSSWTFPCAVEIWAWEPVSGDKAYLWCNIVSTWWLTVKSSDGTAHSCQSLLGSVIIQCSSSCAPLISGRGPVVGPVPGAWRVWSDSSCTLRFCPRTDSVTLTMRQTPDSCPQEGIMILRDKLGDQSILKLVRANRFDLKSARFIIFATKKKKVDVNR